MLTAAAAVLLAAASAAAETPAKVDFVRDIQPIFKASCVKCHGPNKRNPRKKPASGLDLTKREAALKGGRAGKDILPGKAADSMLFKLLSGPIPAPGEKDKDIPPMPKVRRGKTFKPLPAEQVALIRAWIDQGAEWPADAAPAKPRK
jgi:hypothetical protein